MVLVRYKINRLKLDTEYGELGLSCERIKPPSSETNPKALFTLRSEDFQH